MQRIYETVGGIHYRPRPNQRVGNWASYESLSLTSPSFYSRPNKIKENGPRRKAQVTLDDPSGHILQGTILSCLGRLRKRKLFPKIPTFLLLTDFCEVFWNVSVLLCTGDWIPLTLFFSSLILSFGNCPPLDSKPRALAFQMDGTPPSSPFLDYMINLDSVSPLR